MVPRALFGLPTAPHRAPQADDEEFPTTFGVEIEMANIGLHDAERVLKATLGADARSLRAACFCAPAAVFEGTVSDKQGRTWAVKPDEGYTEVITPKLRTRRDLQLLQKVASAMERQHAMPGEGAGLHVHVGASAFTPYQVAHLMTLAHRNEVFLYAALDVHARRRHYCRPLLAACVEDVVAAAPRDVASLRSAYHRRDYPGRDRGINLENLFAQKSEKLTIEFRYFNSTLDPHTIGCHLGLVMGMVGAARAHEGPPPEAALTQQPNWQEFLKAVALAGPQAQGMTAALRDCILERCGSAVLLQDALEAEQFNGPLSLLLLQNVEAHVLEAWATRTSPAEREMLLRQAYPVVARCQQSGGRRGMFETLMTLPSGHETLFWSHLIALVNAHNLTHELSDVLRNIAALPDSSRLTRMRQACALPRRALLCVDWKDFGTALQCLRDVGLAEVCGPGGMAVEVSKLQAVLDLLRRSPAQLRALAALLDKVDPGSTQSELRRRLVSKSNDEVSNFVTQALAAPAQSTASAQAAALLLRLEDPESFIAPQHRQAIDRALHDAHAVREAPAAREWDTGLRATLARMDADELPGLMPCVLQMVALCQADRAVFDCVRFLDGLTPARLASVSNALAGCTPGMRGPQVESVILRARWVAKG